MFPTSWYAPTFFSRTYFPGPAVTTEIVTRDPYLTDFVTVASESARLTVETPAFLAVSADRFVIVESR
jgi:hypothetical protein